MIILAVDDPMIKMARKISFLNFQLDKQKKNQISVKKLFLFYTIIIFFLNSWFCPSKCQLFVLLLAHAILIVFWYIDGFHIESKTFFQDFEVIQKDQDYLLLIFFINVFLYTKNFKTGRKLLITLLTLFLLLIYVGAQLTRLSQIMLYPVFAFLFSLYYFQIKYN